MQKRRTLLAAAVLMLALTLFFGTLPLYASGMQSNSTTAGGNDSLSGTAGGALSNAADAVKGAAEDIFGTPGAGRRDAAGAADNGGNTDANTPENTAGDNPGANPGANPGDAPADNGSLNPDDGGNADAPAGDELLPGETAGDGATLGDVNGDGITDDRAPETAGTEENTAASGTSWGGILLAILTAAAVVVVVILLLPRKSKR